MRDLVLGMAGGYGADALLPFVRSLRETGCPADLALLLHRNPPGTADALRAEGVLPIPVELPGVPERLSYNVTRYAAYAEVLAASSAPRAIVADVRDVLFQKDPFEAVPAIDSLHLFEEHPGKPIGGCIWTSSWLRYRYGDAALPPVASRPVLCSGVVLGATARVLAFVRRVADEIDPGLEARNYMAGYDQGVVNVLAYRGQIRGLVVHAWDRAQVLHLGNAPAGSVRRDPSGRILNSHGEVAAVVHQLDRHP